jgi:hypothetical protein
VLLVKKKDGTWRFCVDYRQLNAVTVKDMYPMPVVEELLDELAGSQFFTNWTYALVIIRYEWLRQMNARLISAHTMAL